MRDPCHLVRMQEIADCISYKILEGLVCFLDRKFSRNSSFDMTRKIRDVYIEDM
jgi:hypothetical protein